MFNFLQGRAAAQETPTTTCASSDLAAAQLSKRLFGSGSKDRIAAYLLALNLFFQLFDGIVSHHALAQSVPEMNPLIDALIQWWGMSRGLVLSKTMAASLLVFVFLMRRKQPSLVVKGLSLTAAVYTIHSIAWSYELLRQYF